MRRLLEEYDNAEEVTKKLQASARASFRTNKSDFYEFDLNTGIKDNLRMRACGCSMIWSAWRPYSLQAADHSRCSEYLQRASIDKMSSTLQVQLRQGFE